MPWLGPGCVRCALPLTGVSDGVCGRCLRKPPPLQHSIAALRYESWASALIHQFKFHRDLRVGRLLSDSLASLVAAHYRERALPQLILPVPLHPQRLYERGFNQALELAKPLSQQFKITLPLTAATRLKNAADQIGLSALARRRNVRGVFQINAALPRHIAIIDDVVTTGATVLELAKTARRHGAEIIDVWCVARTTINVTI